MHIEQLLEGFLSIGGINGAFLLDKKGQFVANVFHGSEEMDLICETSLRSVNVNKDFGFSFEHGSLEQSYIEFDECFLLLEPLSNMQTLVIMGKPGANIGRIRLEMKKTKRILEERSA